MPIRQAEGALVTAHRLGQRMTIAAASPEACAIGLYPGMAVTQARALLPGLEVRDADPQADHSLLARLALFAARRWTPRAAVSGMDGLWLNLDGVAHLFGGEERMGVRILAFCGRIGLTARLAVAGTLGAAHALARYGKDPLFVCSPGGEAYALAPLPLAALRLDGEAIETGRRLGFDHIGDLAAVPRAPLGARLGPSLLTRLDQVMGEANEPFDPILACEAPSATLRLLEPIVTSEAISQVLTDLGPMLVRAMEAQGLGARSVALWCLRVDGEEQTISIGTTRATRNGSHLLSLLRPKLESIDPGFGIERMRLAAVRTELLGPCSIEGPLLSETNVPELASLIDRLVARLGPRRLFRMGAVESDVPERSLRRVGPLSRPVAWPFWPRPVRLLRRPEPLEKVMAELPDHAPVRFSWRGRMHQVRRSDGPERIHGEWWRRRAEAEAVRDYFQVEDEAGARFWLFRRGDGLDGRTGDLSWWMQGLFG